MSKIQHLKCQAPPEAAHRQAMPVARSRRHRAFGCAIAGLLGLVGSASVRAADLAQDEPLPRAGAAYEDPRYADLYGYALPRRRVETYRPETDRPYAPLPRERVYRDDQYDRDRDRYADEARAAGDRSVRGCPSKDEISRTLGADGWRAFQNPRVIDRNRATIDAERPNGRSYRLEVDRCTGEIIVVRPIDGPRYGYAEPSYAPRPLRAY